MEDRGQSRRRQPRVLAGRLASLSIWTVAVLALSLAIAWPLWSLATRSRQVYTLLAAAVVLVLAALALVRAASSRARARSRLRRRARP